MSHSEKDLDRQVTRHKGPLYGMIAVVVFVAVLLFWWLGTEVEEAPGMTDDTAPVTQTAPEQMPDATTPATETAPAE